MCESSIVDLDVCDEICYDVPVQDVVTSGRLWPVSVWDYRNVRFRGIYLCGVCGSVRLSGRSSICETSKELLYLSRLQETQ